MAEKTSGGNMPHRIEAEESMLTPNSTGDANEDIHELRKYIMQMMHSEMELMESVKQHEDSISTVNIRIEKLKEHIASEKQRRGRVELLLTKSAQELKTLGAKKIVLEAKYRQYCDTIVQRDSECLVLKAKYEHLRRTIENLETKGNASHCAISKIASATQELKESHSATIEAMCGENELDFHRAELQKIRAKKRYIDQHAEQIACEAKSLHEKHEQLKQRMAAASGELLDLDATIEQFNEDSSRQRVRLLEEIRHLRALKEQSTKKLATKQKKYRVKMKGEISTLKKRVTFVTRELEGQEMDVEDTLSSLAPFQDRRGQLESRLSDLEAEITQRQASIAVVRAQIDDFDACKEAFDLSVMKSELEAKNIEVESAVRDLAALKDELAQLKEETTRVLEEEHRVASHIVQQSSADVEDELLRACDELKTLQARRTTLVTEKQSTEETCGRLSRQAQKKRQQLKRAKASTTKQHKALCKASQQEEQAKARLIKEKEAAAAVEEAEQLSIRMKASLSEERIVNEAKLAELEKALREKEVELQRQCDQEQARLKTELEAWEAKVQALEAELAFRTK